jgi:diguanylate cyclase (GGDEF)-like protein/PAS domain S-box-containing protein
MRTRSDGPRTSTPEPAPSGDRARAARATIDALTSSRDVFETFFEAARIGLALADLTGRYVRANDTYARLLGRQPEDLIGVPIADVLSGGDPAALGNLLSGAQTSVQAERQYLHADTGTSTWLLHGVATVLSPEGRPAWFAVSAQDITERRRAEQELRELTAELSERAVRDPLTGLANRALLEERLRASLARDARSHECTALLFLDLDGFKAVNDEHGHAVGDDVLRKVAERLRAAVRPSDTVARLGGDEFVILVEGADDTAVGALVPRLRDAVCAPMRVQRLDVTVGVSIGVAVSEAGEADPKSLLSQADARMYESKRASRPA